MTHGSVGHPVGVRRTGLLVGGWALATVLALVLGLQSVSAISESVTGHPRKTLSPASVRAALEQPASSSESSSEATESSSDSQDDSSLSSQSSRPTSSGASSSSVGDDSSSESSRSSDDHSSSEGESSSSSQSAPAAQDQTYHLTGGTVAVRFENGQAHLLYATPAAGFTMENNSNSTSVDVRFRSDSHESRLEAFWSDGPQHTVEEKD